MKRLGFAFLIAVSAAMLAGCHADVTYKFDVHSNNTVTVTAREVIDDQLYGMALSQDTSGDPFGANAAQKAGWTVSRTVDEDGNHVMMMTRTMSLSDLAAKGTDGMPKAAGKTLPFNPSSIVSKAGLFTDTESLNTTIPALMPKAPTSQASSDSWGSAGAAMAAAMMSSIIGLHMELRTPGKVVATNGETTPDGFVRWNINLQGPTDIQYSVQTIDGAHVAIAVAVTILLVLLVIVGVRRKRTNEAAAPIAP